MVHAVAPGISSQTEANNHAIVHGAAAPNIGQRDHATVPDSNLCEDFLLERKGEVDLSLLGSVRTHSTFDWYVKDALTAKETGRPQKHIYKMLSRVLIGPLPCGRQ